jgi:hypothetical protein
MYDGGVSAFHRVRFATAPTSFQVLQGDCSRKEKSRNFEKNDAASFRFGPRERLEDLRLRFPLLPIKLIPGEAAAHSDIEPLAIVQALAIVVAECLFIKIPEKVIRFHAEVGAVDTASVGSSSSWSVGMDLAPNVLNRVIDYFVLKFVKPFNDFRASVKVAHPARTWSRISDCSVSFFMFSTTSRAPCCQRS